MIGKRRSWTRPSRLVYTSLLIAALMMSGCCYRQHPRVYCCRDVEDYVPDHLAVDERHQIGGELKAEYFDPYKPLSEDYRIAIGDVLEVAIFGHDDTLVDKVVIAPDGRLYYMFLDGLPAAGRTVDEVAADIEERVAHLFISPEVTIIPKKIAQRTFRILGKVNRPGVYPIVSSLTIRQAIGDAGGIAYGGFSGTTIAVANFRESFLVRDGDRLAIDFERLIHTEGSDQNIYLQPGDYIYIASSLVHEVYLLGAVVEQKPIQYKDGLTLVASLSGVAGLRGGFLSDADLSRITVVRGSLDNPQVITANIIKILEGGAKDFYLRPGDIVYVPQKHFRFGRELVRTAINAFMAAFGAESGGHYAGEHWFPSELNENP